MFTQDCFVRKNNPKLIEKLEKLGYVKPLYDEEYDNDCVIGLIAEQGDIFPLRKDDNTDYIKHGFIDCQDHEELFIALAALLNDTDRNQWFICQEDYLSFHGLKPINKGDWQLNTEYDKLTYGLKKLWRKATAKEILKDAILYV